MSKRGILGKIRTLSSKDETSHNIYGDETSINEMAEVCTGESVIKHWLILYTICA